MADAYTGAAATLSTTIKNNGPSVATNVVTCTNVTKGVNGNDVVFEVAA